MRRQRGPATVLSQREQSVRSDVYLLDASARRQGGWFGGVLEPPSSLVYAMIDEVVTLLKAEQGEDSSKKAYCIRSFDETGDEAMALAHQLTGHKVAFVDYNDQLPNTVARIRPCRSRSLSRTRAWRRRLRADRSSIRVSDC